MVDKCTENDTSNNLFTKALHTRNKTKWWTRPSVPAVKRREGTKSGHLIVLECCLEITNQSTL